MNAVLATSGVPTADEIATRFPQAVRRADEMSAAWFGELGRTNEVAIVRLEQLYPWPADALRSALGRYRSAREWVWVQEESQKILTHRLTGQ